ncbi:MAG TPA: TonB-dependent siderophore receptor [Pirellulales bacterium]|jgi:iron complex outermembrane receptor protein|nr:TonB-dependent siderophore receptor [Pirellulales bacterium]
MKRSWLSGVLVWGAALGTVAPLSSTAWAVESAETVVVDPFGAAAAVGPAPIAELDGRDETADLTAYQPGDEPPAVTSPLPPTLPETNVIAEPQPVLPQPLGNPDAIRIPSVLRGTVFNAPPVNGYNAPTSTVGTMVNMPTQYFPGTIDTVTRSVLRDQQVLMMDDTIRDIPTAVKAYGSDGVIRPDQFFVRGFEVTSQNWRKDGYLDPTYVPRDPANIERIDVLKGPSSVLYGAAQPTGTFNVTTKKPLADRFATAGFMTGSYGLQRYTIDANTSLNEDKSALVRINAAYQDNYSFRNAIYNQREFFCPIISYALDDDTSVTWAGEYQHDNFRLDQGVPAINGNPFAISNNTFTGNPNGDVADYYSYRSTFTFERVLSDNWSMRVGEMSLFYNTPSSTTVLDNAMINPATGFISSPVIPRDTTVAYPFTEQNNDILEAINGKFDTGDIAHNVVFGAEQDWFVTNHDTFTQSSTTNLLTGGSGSAYPPINVASAGAFPLGSPINTFPTAAYTQSSFDNPYFAQNRFGWFGQDIMELAPRLKLMLGGRIDYMKQTYIRGDITTISGYGTIPADYLTTTDTFTQFSPRVGLSYDLIPERMTAYAMYSRSFTPSVGVVNFTNVPLLPEYGDIWEGGIKTKLTDRLSWNNAAFYIREHNVNVELFEGTTGAGVPIFATDQSGLVRSQGVESNLTGQWTERLSTISNFGYVDVKQTSIDPTVNGKGVRGVPNWTGNVFTRYNFIQNRRETVGTAIGMIYVGDRMGDYASPLVLPSYNIWDLGFYYNRGRFNASLLWDNIFNVNYALSSLSQYQVIPGTPSNVRMTLSATF